MAPGRIQVLMFNRLARDQFVESLAQVGLPESMRPAVNTFHSYAYRLIDAQGFKQWFGHTEELAHLALLKARRSVCRAQFLETDDIDLEEARQAIELWKGALIPPSRAGYRGRHSEVYIEVYRVFEELRQKDNGLTYADFVPLALQLLSRQPHTSQIRHLIVDEYQDVNLGQQRLVEWLARDGADVMVVGDDDQTIYEWRGARSDYILGEFENTFTNKPHCTYKLTRSFRFGYCIAQSSYNVILHNARRLDKHVIAHNPVKGGDVTLITDTEEKGGYANRRLVEEIIGLVVEQKVPPAAIRVLARTYAQLDSLQTELLHLKVPFKVLGRAPFLQSGESQALLNYVRIAASLAQPVTGEIRERFLTIANKPSRYLARHEVDAMLGDGMARRQTLHELLHQTLHDYRKFTRGSARDHLEDLAEILYLIRQRMASPTEGKAGPLLAWIDRTTGFREHYEDYYGAGEASLIRIKGVTTFMEYAQRTELSWQDFIHHVDNTDTTQGHPEPKWIKMMTIHRAKGLEFDYVVIPDCQERFMPLAGNSDDLTYDTQDPQRTPQPAEWIESERRLFYVGTTRARKELFLGAPALQTRPGHRNRQQDTPQFSRFLEELELPETRALASAVVPAARGRPGHDDKLLALCQKLSAFHHMVRHIKDEYAARLPKRLRPRLARVQLSPAARPWRYRQDYASPAGHPSRSAQARSGPDDQNPWPWIETRSQTRRAGHSRRHRAVILHPRTGGQGTSDEDLPF